MKPVNFEVGKRYRYLSRPTHLGFTELLSEDYSFLCHAVDKDGYAWSRDSSFFGITIKDGEGWCVADLSRLLNGEVVEVVE